jgi:ribosome production factor 2
MAPTNQQAKAARAKQLAGGKAPKAKVQRYLKTTETKLVETARSCLLLKGIRCSQSMGTVLKDLRAVLQPNCKLMNKKNAITAFDTQGQQSLEFLSTKNDCSLFCMASHNKKRPNNLVLGRTFDRQILDMVELGIVRYKSLADYGGQVAKKRIGSKPLMLFCGDLWTTSGEYSKLQNLLIDFYKGDPVDKLVISGVDHIMVFTIAAASTSEGLPLVHQRTYFVQLKKNPSGGTTPVPLLESCGPDMDFSVRRTQMASPELWKASLKQPLAIKSKKKKNHTTNIFGETIGRLHLEKQDIDKLQGRKSKALRRADKISKEEEKKALESELGQEKQEMGQEFKQHYGFEEEETERKRGGKKAAKK